MSTLLYIIYLLLLIYAWLIVGRALLSWFPVRRGGTMFTIKRTLHILTEPYLRLLRRILPKVRFGSVGIDLSAVVGVIILFVLIQVLAWI